MIPPVSSDDRTPVDDFAGLAFLLDYVDAKGDSSRRRITVQAIEARYGQSYIRAFCHERRASRSFRADRIRSITDLRDGQTYDDALAYLRHLAGDRVPSTAGQQPPDGQDRAFGRCRDGIRILMFLARCDGHVHPRELDIVRDYCRDRTENERWGKLNYELAHLIEYASRQVPDAETFRRCLERIVEAADTGEHVRTIVSHAYAMAGADGVLNPSEKAFLAELRSIMSDGGWDFDVSVKVSGTELTVTVSDVDDD